MGTQNAPAEAPKKAPSKYADIEEVKRETAALLQAAKKIEKDVGDKKGTTTQVSIERLKQQVKTHEERGSSYITELEQSEVKDREAQKEKKPEQTPEQTNDINAHIEQEKKQSEDLLKKRKEEREQLLKDYRELMLLRSKMGPLGTRGEIQGDNEAEKKAGVLLQPFKMIGDFTQNKIVPGLAPGWAVVHSYVVDPMKNVFDGFKGVLGGMATGTRNGIASVLDWMGFKKAAEKVRGTPKTQEIKDFEAAVNMVRGQLDLGGIKLMASAKDANGEEPFEIKDKAIFDRLATLMKRNPEGFVFQMKTKLEAETDVSKKKEKGKEKALSLEDVYKLAISVNDKVKSPNEAKEQQEWDERVKVLRKMLRSEDRNIILKADPTDDKGEKAIERLEINIDKVDDLMSMLKTERKDTYFAELERLFKDKAVSLADLYTEAIKIKKTIGNAPPPKTDTTKV